MPEAGSGRRRTQWWWAASTALAVVTAVALAIAQPWGSEAPGGAEGAATTSSPPSASVTSSGDASGLSSDDPTASESAGTESSAPPAESGPAPRPTAPPVPLDGSATPVAGLEISLTSIESVEGEATIPGEVGGPALRVSVQAHNGNAAPFDLTGGVVNLYFGPDQRPAVSLLEPGAVPFPDTVAAGADATAVWVFTVPQDQRDQVLVEVDLSPEVTVVLFQGSVA